MVNKVENKILNLYKEIEMTLSVKSNWEKQTAEIVNHCFGFFNL